MTWEWKAPVFSIGWLAAFVILIAALMLGFMSMLPKEWVLAVAAICAVRL